MRHNARSSTLLVFVALTALALSAGAVSIAMAATAGPAAAGSRVAVGVKHYQSIGSILDAGPKHLTVYAFARDHHGRSSCNGACVKGWPPVMTVGKPRAAAGAITADLGTITRSNGRKQVTYKGHPLYFFVGDQTASTAAGQRLKAFGARWYVLAASGREITTAPTQTTTTSTTTYTNPYGSPTTTTPSTTSTTTTSTTTTSTTPTSTYTYPYGY